MSASDLQSLYIYMYPRKGNANSLITMNKRLYIKKIISVTFIILFLISGVFDIMSVRSLSALGDLGEPRNAYDQGMAGILEGDILVLSLFVNTPSDKWTVHEMNETLPKLQTATDYLTKQAGDYKVDVSFNYDWSKDRKLRYRAIADFETDDKDFTDKLDELIGSLVNGRINYDDILSSYGADGIFMMVYFNAPDRSYAIAYDGEDIPQETVIMFNDGDAAEYAHEILHVFGAHDFYDGEEYTDDVVKFIKKKYPDDIMLDTVMKKDEISNSIGPVTAYHIGWTDETKEFKEYDQLLR